MNFIYMKKNKISIINSDQVINMGGPWVGDLSIGEKIITNNVVDRNLIFDDVNNRVFFVKYHLISKWQKDNFFTINIFNIKDQSVYESIKHFSMVYLKQIVTGNILEIYIAFHDQNIANKRLFYIDQEVFEMIK